MPAPNLLDDPAERRHGGIIVSHTLSPDALRRVIRNNCRLVSPSVGIEFASAVPIYGEAALLAGPDAVRAMPEHGLRIFSWDLWSGSGADLPHDVCPSHVSPQVAGAEGNCTIQRVRHLLPYGPAAVRKALEYYYHPMVPGPCDAVSDLEGFARQTGAAILAWADRGAPEPAEGDNFMLWEVDDVCGPLLAESQGRPRPTHHRGQRVMQYGREDPGAFRRCVARFAAKAQDPERFVAGLARFMSPTGWAGLPNDCRALTPEDAIDYHQRLSEFFGARGQTRGKYANFVLGASELAPEQVLEQTGPVKLVPHLGDELGDWSQAQAELIQTLRAWVTERRCPTELVLGGETLEVPEDSLCSMAAARQALAATSAADVAQALGLANLEAAGKLLADIARVYRDYPTTYYEAKTYGYVPLALFPTAVLPSGDAAGIRALAAENGCTIRIVPYEPAETLQAKINEIHGLAPPASDRVRVTIGSRSEYVPANAYAQIRNRLFAARDAGRDVWVGPFAAGGGDDLRSISDDLYMRSPGSLGVAGSPAQFWRIVADTAPELLDGYDEGNVGEVADFLENEFDGDWGDTVASLVAHARQKEPMSGAADGIVPLVERITGRPYAALVGETLRQVVAEHAGLPPDASERDYNRAWNAMISDIASESRDEAGDWWEHKKREIVKAAAEDRVAALPREYRKALEQTYSPPDEFPVSVRLSDYNEVLTEPVDVSEELGRIYAERFGLGDD